MSPLYFQTHNQPVSHTKLSYGFRRLGS